MTETRMSANNLTRVLNLSEIDLERLYHTKSTDFTSEAHMRDWLSEHQVDLPLADSKKGLSSLFRKIENGEARIVLDDRTQRIFRVARVAKIAVEATIQGEQYPLVELCQIFLNTPIDAQALITRDPDQIPSLIAKLNVRTAQVRDSQELWETLINDEEAITGARRGLIEELGYTQTEAALATMHMDPPLLQFEKPIDWPGIPSILETNEAKAVLPEEISKAAYVELEGGNQITIFVATPGAPLVQALLAKVLPNIHYVHSLE